MQLCLEASSPPEQAIQARKRKIERALLCHRERRQVVHVPRPLPARRPARASGARTCSQHAAVAHAAPRAALPCRLRFRRGNGRLRCGSRASAEGAQDYGEARKLAHVQPNAKIIHAQEDRALVISWDHFGSPVSTAPRVHRSVSPCASEKQSPIFHGCDLKRRTAFHVPQAISIVALQPQEDKEGLQPRVPSRPLGDVDMVSCCTIIQRQTSGKGTRAGAASDRASTCTLPPTRFAVPVFGRFV